MGVMGRLAASQYGGAAASGTNYYGGGSSGVQAAASLNAGPVQAGASARVTGVVVLVALAIALIGYHGLRG